MTVSAAGSAATAPPAATTATTTPATTSAATNAATAQGLPSDFTLGIPFSQAVGGGSIDNSAGLRFTLLAADQQAGNATRFQLNAIRASLVTVIGAYGGNAEERASLAADRTRIQGDVEQATTALNGPGGANDQLAADQATLTAAQTRLDTDTANGADQKTLADDLKAVNDAKVAVNADKETISTLKATIENGNAQVAARTKQIADLENVFLTGFTNAVSSAHDRIATALRNAGANDQVLTEQLASIVAGLRQFLDEARKRGISRSKQQEEADDGLIAARADDELVREQTISADELVRNFLTTGEPLPKNTRNQADAPAQNAVADDTVADDAGRDAQRDQAAARTSTPDPVAANAGEPARRLSDNVAGNRDPGARRAAADAVDESHANGSIAQGERARAGHARSQGHRRGLREKSRGPGRRCRSYFANTGIPRPPVGGWRFRREPAATHGGGYGRAGEASGLASTGSYVGFSGGHMS